MSNFLQIIKEFEREVYEKTDNILKLTKILEGYEKTSLSQLFNDLSKQKKERLDQELKVKERKYEGILYQIKSETYGT
jgi:hypothetical protein